MIGINNCERELVVSQGSTSSSINAVLLSYRRCYGIASLMQTSHMQKSLMQKKPIMQMGLILHKLHTLK